MFRKKKECFKVGGAIIGIMKSLIKFYCKIPHKFTFQSVNEHEH